MIKLISLISCISLSIISFAQKVDSSFMANMNMRSIGPAGMSGRVTSIDVDLKDTKHILVGTASGGLWSSTNSGTSWQPIFDNQPLQSIGAVAFSQKNTDVIYVGTGEGNPRNSHSSGAGMFKSLNGGKDWIRIGLEETKTIHRIIVHPDDPNTVVVGAMGSIWGANKERGVFKTTDGGKTWKNILFVNDTTGCADLIVDPTNPNKMIAAMWHYHREPWFFTSGGKGSGLYITYDGGDNWKRLDDKSGLPKGTLGRIGLSICHDKPNVVYALVESKKTALYRSSNGGENWQKISDKNIGNRPFYYADIYCDPKNENRLYNLYSVISKSEDGGKSFKTIMSYGSGHPDHHAFWINPNNPDHLIDGNDGGINISNDGGSSWRFVENLPVGQFYHINYDTDIPYNIYGGMQDNGSWVGPSEVWHTGGIQNADWQEVLFGDGFDVMPKAGNSRYGYAMYQGGNLHTYDRETGNTQKIQPVQLDSIPLRYNWNAPMAQDPFNQCGMYYGSQYLHYSADCGQSWKTLSADLTTNDTLKQKQAESGGLTIDATKAENYTTLTAIAPSPLNENVIWVGTDDGNLWVTRDKGENWTKLNAKLDKMAPKGSWIPQIVASSFNEKEAYVIINDYRRNNWKPYAIKVSEYGSKMSNLIDANVQGHCHSIIQDPKEENLMFLGTENGLFVSIDKGVSWTKWNSNFPSVPTIDLKIHPREADLIIGTFGRAAFILDDIAALRELATDHQTLEKDFVLWDAQDAYLNSYKQNPGMRFGANSHYRGTNGSYGANFSYYLKSTDAPKKKEGEKTEKDSLNWKEIIVTVEDPNNKAVRHYKVKAKKGLNQLNWFMNSDGVRFPGSPKPKKDDLPSGGHEVLAGNYTVIAQFGSHIDTAKVSVKPDPRSPYNFNATKERHAQIDAFYETIELATRGFDFLEDVKKEVKLIKSMSDKIEVDSIKTKLEKDHKKLLAKVDSLQELYRISPDFNGYDHVSIRLNNLIGDAFGYLGDMSLKINPNAEQAIENASNRISEVVGHINYFMESDWQEYTQFISTLEFNLFEKHEKIKIK